MIPDILPGMLESCLYLTGETLMKIPPQRQDINPIGHLWTYLEIKIKTNNISLKETLKHIL